jgi:hypothetical protein
MSLIACEEVIDTDFGAQTKAQCAPTMPPDPPSIKNVGGANSLVVAVSQVDLGETDDPVTGEPRWRNIGFNLDRLCVSQWDSPACLPPAWTGTRTPDGNNGIDNAIGSMLHDQQAVFGIKAFTSDYVTQSIDRGSHAPMALFRITDYGGYSEDDQVRVEWFTPVALGTSPKWDGSDVFDVSDESADQADGSPDVARFVDAHAYVAGYRLVAHFDMGPRLNLVNVPFRVTDALLVGEINMQLDKGLKKATIAGHIDVHEMFTEMPALTKTFVGDLGVVCMDTPTYDKTKGWYCGHADALSGGVACNLLSFGVAIDTHEVKIGNVVAAPKHLGLCPAATDPAADSCDTPP